ncbi:MAG: tyrosine-type recombinase/integrase, partial [Chloroflexi bacterium]|nr:tyrosine-type recombinase/integrase [Chloroflexota bacterium]
CFDSNHSRRLYVWWLFRARNNRDTFAVSLLVQGVAIEDVSALLGHSSIRTTERYYAPWDRRRRERLRQIVQEANRSDPVLAEIDD